MKSEVRSQKSGEVCSRQYAVGSKNAACLLLLAAYCLLLAVFTGCAATQVDIAKDNAPAILYTEGLTLYNDGDYQDAIDKFKKVMADYPLSSFAVDAELLLADAYYNSVQYADAASYYANFISLRPNHPKAAYALFQNGMSYLREISSIDRDQTNTKKALLAFSDIILIYPSSIYIEKAKEMVKFLKKRLAEREFYIANFYFNDKKYKGALARFAEILKEYPDSGLSDKVLYYIGKSYIELGEKELAKDAFSTLISNFPQSSFVGDVKSWLEDNRINS